jgi:hypothetical protein
MIEPSDAKKRIFGFHMLRKRCDKSAERLVVQS